MSKAEMTMHERMTRIYAHQEADRAPVVKRPRGVRGCVQEPRYTSVAGM